MAIIPHVIFANNATSLTAFPVLATDTTITIEGNDLASFPVPDVSTGAFFYATLEDRRSVPTRREIVKVTNVSGASFIVVRGQDGTVAGDYFTGTVFSARLNRAALLALGDEETAARIAADEAEAAARAAADAVLQANINAEAAARASGDVSLQTQLNSEITRAQNAEASIQSQINSGNAVFATRDALNSEIVRATNAEAAEVHRATAAETALANSIVTQVGAESTRAQNAEAAEANARAAADAHLQSEIDALSGHASGVPYVQSGTHSTDNAGKFTVVYPTPFANRALDFQLDAGPSFPNAYFSSYEFELISGTVAVDHTFGILLCPSPGTIQSIGPLANTNFNWWVTGY
jgi:hypothetical protein